MLRFVLAFIVSLSLGFGALAQEVLRPDPDIEAVISGQFGAFLERDVDGAWQFASPNIQFLYPTPEQFGDMVEGGFPMVWTPERFAFIDLQSFGGVIVQRVEVIDQAGTAHYLGYQMVEVEGVWRINGVQVLRAPALGV